LVCLTKKIYLVLRSNLIDCSIQGSTKFFLISIMHNNKIRNDKTSKVLMSLVKMAEKEFVPSIGPIKGKIVAKIVKRYKPRNILEIGTLYGYSAILVASMLPSSDGKVVTIEIDK
jgi:predicted O-methyltransferase YrrM